METARSHGLKPRNREGFVGRFCTVASDRPDAIAYEGIEDPRSWTYGQLLDLAERFRASFEKLEIEKGDVILVVLPSGPSFLASMVALASLSAVSVPTDRSLSAFEMDRLLRDARPVGIVTDSKTYASCRRLFEGQARVRFVLNVDPPSREAPGERPRLVSLLAFDGEHSTLEPPAGDPVITCHYTYKGLGYPLGTLHRYHDYSFCIEGLEERHPVEIGDVNLLLLPLHSVYGLTMLALGPLSVGCRLVFAEQVGAYHLIDLLEKYNVRGTCLVPLLVPKLLVEARGRGGRARLKLNPHLEIGSTSAYLDGKTIGMVAEATGVEIQQGFGLTEALAVTSTSPRIEERGTLGTPICKGTEVRILDAAGREAPAGQTGEIVVGGPTVAKGFLRKPAEESRFFRGGRFRTGDLGYKDRAGLLHFAGRAAPIAKIGSQMVDLLEVEHVLGLHPAVLRAKAVVRGQMDRRNYISASVVISGKTEMDPRELRRFCASMLSRHKVPTEVKVHRRREAFLHSSAMEVPSLV